MRTPQQDEWGARLARLRERATTLQFPIDHDIRAVLERMDRVRALHERKVGYNGEEWCDECINGEGCAVVWPCPTMLALDGKP